jgi:hypothetical protein
LLLLGHGGLQLAELLGGLLQLAEVFREGVLVGPAGDGGVDVGTPARGRSGTRRVSRGCWVSCWASAAMSGFSTRCALMIVAGETGTCLPFAIKIFNLLLASLLGDNGGSFSDHHVSATGVDAGRGGHFLSFA